MHTVPFNLPEASWELIDIAHTTHERLKSVALAKENEVSIYLGHALTGVSEEVLEPVRSIRTLITESNGIPARHVLDFYGLGEARIPEVIVEKDLKQALRADLMVALRITASDGVGMEIVMRAFMGLPLLILFPEGSNVSRMVTGQSWFGDHVRVREYSNPNDAFQKILFMLFGFPEPLEWASKHKGNILL